MTRRSKLYFWRKRAERYMKTPVGEMCAKIREDLDWHGMAVTKTWLEDGVVKVRRLTYTELCDLKMRQLKGEVIPEEFTLGGEYLVNSEMKQRIDELRELFKTQSMNK